MSEQDEEWMVSQNPMIVDDEIAWTRSFAEKRDVLRRLADEARAEDDRGETLSLDDWL